MPVGCGQSSILCCMSVVGMVGMMVEAWMGVVGYKKIT